jgi:hypothetical protein
VARNESKIRLHSEKYQTAWEGIRKLNNGDEGMVGWRVLRREDIRCMEDAEDLRKKAKAREAQNMKRRQKKAELRAQGLLSVEEEEEMDCDEEEEGVDDRGPENQRLVSWIWTLAGTEGSDAAFGEGASKIWMAVMVLI